MVVKKVLKEEP